MSAVRKLGVIVSVAMTLTLAVCTSSSAQPKSFPSSARPRPTAPTTVSRAELSRFVALAHRGLREPFESVYRFNPPVGNWGDQLRNFRLWSEPPADSDHEGNFVYEAPFGRGTFRFIQKRYGDYECLRTAPPRSWKCVGPFGAQSIMQSQQVEGYRMPLWIMEYDLTTDLVGSLVFSHRTLFGRRLWCLDQESEGVLCLTKTGQLAFDDKLFIGSQLELVSLVLTESKSAFLLPAKPKPWRGQVLPNLCGKVQCPSIGLL
jgi:hypothetical protein